MKSKSKIPPKSKEQSSKTEESKIPFFKWHKKTGFTIAGYINEESKDGRQRDRTKKVRF